MHHNGKGREKPPALSPMNRNAAGVDVGAEGHFVAIPADRDERVVRELGAFTPDLYQLAEWLERCGVSLSRENDAPIDVKPLSRSEPAP